MAVVDVNAWVGSWPSKSINAGAAEVRGMLKSVGVERIFMAPLDAALTRVGLRQGGGVS